MHTAYITISTHSYDSDPRRTKPETDFLGLIGAEKRWERLVEGPELLELGLILRKLSLIGTNTNDVLYTGVIFQGRVFIRSL